MHLLRDLDVSDKSVSDVDSVPVNSPSISNGKPKPMVLVAIHLSESPQEDLIAFLLGEGLLPEYVNGVQVTEIQGVYTSNSTLVLATMPLEIWSLLPKEVPCSFVANVYSGDLLRGIQATSLQQVISDWIPVQARLTSVSGGHSLPIIYHCR